MKADHVAKLVDDFAADPPSQGVRIVGQAIKLFAKPVIAHHCPPSSQLRFSKHVFENRDVEVDRCQADDRSVFVAGAREQVPEQLAGVVLLALDVEADVGIQIDAADLAIPSHRVKQLMGNGSQKSVGHRPNRLAVQCKRLSRPVGAGAVQEVVAGAERRCSAS